MNRTLNISIVSQNEIEREGLRRILTEKNFVVSGVFRNHADLDLDVVFDDRDSLPLVIVDSVSDEEGLETCRFVHERWPDCKIVVLASNCQGQVVYDAFQAGIDGYVGKHISVDSFAEMLKLVALGEKMIPSQVFFDLSALKKMTVPNEVRMNISEANLSDREVEILKGLIRGDPNKVISRAMDITEATVKVHVKSILRKLGVMNRTQAAIWGMSRGLTRDVVNDLPPETRSGGFGVNGSGNEPLFPKRSCLT